MNSRIGPFLENLANEHGFDFIEKYQQQTEEFFFQISHDGKKSRLLLAKYGDDHLLPDYLSGTAKNVFNSIKSRTK